MSLRGSGELGVARVEGQPSRAARPARGEQKHDARGGGMLNLHSRNTGTCNSIKSNRARSLLVPVLKSSLRFVVETAYRTELPISWLMQHNLAADDPAVASAYLNLFAHVHAPACPAPRSKLLIPTQLHAFLPGHISANQLRELSVTTQNVSVYKDQWNIDLTIFILGLLLAHSSCQFCVVDIMLLFCFGHISVFTKVE